MAMSQFVLHGAVDSFLQAMSVFDHMGVVFQRA
jgi:hypothetical protein